MKELLTSLKTRYKLWRDNRFLKKHGCTTWKQYHRQYDPDISPRSTKIKDFYYGYKYWHIFEDHNHQIYWWDLAYDGSTKVIEWCENNCNDKFRFDAFRVINGPATAWQWEMNDLGGGDHYFAAFKNEQDFMMFLLRWA